MWGIFPVALLNRFPKDDSEKEVTSSEQARQKGCGEKIQRSLNFL
jgi:hypothetical protein